MVMVDPETAGVALPHDLADDLDGAKWPPGVRHTVGLHIGRNLAIPIPDLEVNDWGIGGTLSFGGRPFRCLLPWESIWSVVSGDTVLTFSPSQPPKTAAEPSEPAKPSGRLTLVK